MLWDDLHTAYAKIVMYTKRITAGVANEREPGSDLESLAHLVGDVHQPLLAVTNKDRGGNCLYMTFVTQNDTPSVKLKFHGAWDHDIFEDRLEKSERLVTKQLLQDWKLKIPAKLSAATAQVKADVEDAVRGWIQESHDHAVNDLNDTLVPAVSKLVTVKVPSSCVGAAPATKTTVRHLTSVATDNAFALMEDQIVIAGVRLAAPLNATAE